MNREKKSKNLLLIMVILFVSLIVVVFLMFKLTTKKDDKTPNEEIIIEEKVDNSSAGNNDDEAHSQDSGETTVFEESEDPAVEIEELVLSAPETLPESYNLDSGPNFKGVFNEKRIYVLANGGQLYHYDLETGETFTYENLVKETFVDSTTGNLIFTRELKDEDLNSNNKEGEIGLYRVLKENPEDELIYKIPANTVLQQGVFFKDYIIISSLNYDSGTFSTKVIPTVGTKLDSFGKDLEKTLTKYYYNLTTDGKRLVGFDFDSNEIVELTSGKRTVLHKISEETFGSSLDVYGDSYIFSYLREDGSGALVYNGKELVKDSFIELHFYNKNYAFVTTGMNLQLLNLNTGSLEPLTDIASDVVVTENNVYFSNNAGEINKITVEKKK